MPRTMSNGVSIHYRAEGDGPALVLQHGFTGSSEDWFELGYVERLKSVRQVVVIDGRGHGASDKPHESAYYTPQHQAQDVVSVLDDMGLPEVDFFGYSMGGRIGLALAKYAPERIRAYVIGGASPYDLPAETAKEMWVHLKRGAASMTEYLESQVPLSAATRQRHLANDVEALKAFFLNPISDPFDDVLPTINAPCLLIVGEEDFVYDGVLECARHLPNATLVTIPGLNHAQGFWRSDITLPHVESFLAKLDGR